MTIEKKPLPKRAGFIAVVCAGTSDLPVAEEAAVTAEIMGNRVERIHDVGVAGLHRMLARMETIAKSERHRRRRWHGRRAAERAGGTGVQAGHRRADKRRLRREFRRHCGAAGAC